MASCATRMPSPSRVRSAVPMVLWCSAILYACWRFACATQYLPLARPHGFVNSKYGLLRKMDDTHIRWNLISGGFFLISRWLLLQPVITKLLLRTWKEAVPSFYILYTTAFLLLEYGCVVTMFWYSVYSVMFLAALSGRKDVCYILFTAFFLFYKSYLTPSFIERSIYDNEVAKGYLMDAGLCYSFIRSLSFALDCVERNMVPPVRETLAYYLYLPNFFYGPAINYSDFARQLKRLPEPLSISTLRLFLRLLYCYALFILYDLHVHFFYHQALSRHPLIVEALDCWSLAGFCFLCTFSVFLEHRSCFLLGNTLAALEGIRLPEASICIARLYSTTHLWKYYNRGLHLWFARYFYVPFAAEDTGHVKRAVGAGLVFGLVWVSHNKGANIAAWCSITWMCVLLEKIVIQFGSTPRGLWIQKSFPNLVRLVQLVLYTISLLLAYMSSMFVTTGWVVTFIVSKKLLGAPVPAVLLLFAIYCGVLCSLEYHKQRSQRSRTCREEKSQNKE